MQPTGRAYTSQVRVVKTARQAATEDISYYQTVAMIVEADGVGGLFFRGLTTKLLSNGLQARLRAARWRYTLHLSLHAWHICCSGDAVHRLLEVLRGAHRQAADAQVGEQGRVRHGLPMLRPPNPCMSPELGERLGST